jgi:hypothetical protein
MHRFLSCAASNVTAVGGRLFAMPFMLEYQDVLLSLSAKSDASLCVTLMLRLSPAVADLRRYFLCLCLLQCCLLMPSEDEVVEEHKDGGVPIPYGAVAAAAALPAAQHVAVTEQQENNALNYHLICLSGAVQSINDTFEEKLGTLEGDVLYTPACIEAVRDMINALKSSLKDPETTLGAVSIESLEECLAHTATLTAHAEKAQVSIEAQLHALDEPPQMAQLLAVEQHKQRATCKDMMLTRCECIHPLHTLKYCFNQSYVAAQAIAQIMQARIDAKKQLVSSSAFELLLEAATVCDLFALVLPVSPTCIVCCVQGADALQPADILKLELKLGAHINGRITKETFFKAKTMRNNGSAGPVLVFWKKDPVKQTKRQKTKYGYNIARRDYGLVEHKMQLTISSVNATGDSFLVNQWKHLKHKSSHVVFSADDINSGDFQRQLQFELINPCIATLTSDQSYNVTLQPKENENGYEALCAQLWECDNANKPLRNRTLLKEVRDEKKRLRCTMHVKLLFGDTQYSNQSKLSKFEWMVLCNWANHSIASYVTHVQYQQSIP